MRMMFLFLALAGSAGADEKMLRLRELAGQVGTQIDGRVVKIGTYGAWVDVGGAKGYLPVSDMGWTRERDPHALVKMEQNVKVTVVAVDLKEKSLSLSMRRDEDDPWRRVPTRYAPGTRTSAKVMAATTRTNGTGVFVELEPWVDALVHYSDLPPGKKTIDYRTGDLVEITVLAIDTARRRISASMRAAAP